jgi:hypothetical protein
VTPAQLPSWKETGWNTLRFQCPQDWDVIISGNHHLLFENNFHPVLELRWHANKGNTERAIKNILRNLQKDSGLVPHKSIFSSWQSLTAKYSVYLLRTGEGKNGCAALLTCLKCGTSLLFYFFDAIPADHTSIATLFSSISCHDHTDVNTLWALQDFRLSLPVSYQLSGYNFGAGLTRLSFVDGSLIAHICRLAPASQRLHTASMADLLMVLGDVVINTDAIQQSEYMVSHSRHPPIYRQILDRIKRKMPFHEMILRHHPKCDRLTGLFLFDKKPISKTLAATILNNYEIFPI